MNGVSAAVLATGNDTRAIEGIHRGHMELHSRNVAIQAGATGDMIDKIARTMVSENKVRADRAKELLDELMSVH